MKYKCLINNGNKVVFDYKNCSFITSHKIELYDSFEDIEHYNSYLLTSYKFYNNKASEKEINFIKNYLKECKLTTFKLVEFKEEKQFIPAY